MVLSLEKIDAQIQFSSSSLDCFRILTISIYIYVEALQVIFVFGQQIYKFSTTFSPHHLPKKISSLGEGFVSTLPVSCYFFTNIEEFWIYTMYVTNNRPR
uniref:Uncharacterized protein n=1 Tax=Arundo donax TaxID=35708 RepID=A0A0A9EP41_ARUDO